MKKLFQSEMAENESMKEYISRVKLIAEELSAIGKPMERHIVIGVLLNGLPERYRYLVVALESQIDTISMQDITARLLDEESRNPEEPYSERAFAASVKYPQSQKKCNHCGRTGHLERECWECYYCGKKVHRERDCFKKVKDKEKKEETSMAMITVF